MSTELAKSLYLVWNPSGNSNPRKRHASVDSATQEAKRLAQENPDQEFFVLRAITSIKYSSDPFIYKQYSKEVRQVNIEVNASKYKIPDEDIFYK